MASWHGGRPIEILLIEDNPGDIRLTLEALKESRIYNRVSVVEDGNQARRYLHQSPRSESAPMPDLVLLDLNLPGIDGREILEDMKASPELCEIPVIALTASNADQDILRAYELQARAYLNKPVNGEDLLKIIESIEGFWITIIRRDADGND